jgi:hypothetical protein
MRLLSGPTGECHETALFAASQPAITANRAENVVRFDARWRTSHVRSDTDAQPHLSGGVVVRLPLANKETQKAPRTDETVANGRPQSPSTNDTGFTTIDFVATAFLILSVFATPALVWTLLRSASFG